MQWICLHKTLHLAHKLSSWASFLPHFSYYAINRRQWASYRKKTITDAFLISLLPSYEVTEYSVQIVQHLGSLWHTDIWKLKLALHEEPPYNQSQSLPDEQTWELSGLILVKRIANALIFNWYLSTFNYTYKATSGVLVLVADLQGRL